MWRPSRFLVAMAPLRRNQPSAWSENLGGVELDEASAGPLSSGDDHRRERAGAIPTPGSSWGGRNGGRIGGRSRRSFESVAVFGTHRDLRRDTPTSQPSARILFASHAEVRMDGFRMTFCPPTAICLRVVPNTEHPYIMLASVVLTPFHTIFALLVFAPSRTEP